MTQRVPFGAPAVSGSCNRQNNEFNLHNFKKQTFRRKAGTEIPEGLPPLRKLVFWACGEMGLRVRGVLRN